MGRLGRLWGCEYHDVEPDMLVTAKGFSGGVHPMSAVVTRPECLDFFGESPYRSISSFAWSNLGARVSLAALEETERLLPRLAALGDEIWRSVQAVQRRYPSVLRGVRRAGMMFGLDFPDAETGTRFLAEMFARQVLVVASSQRLDVIKLYPPLVLERADVAVFAERMEDALKSMAGA